MKWILVLAFLISATPAWAQLYSYRSPSGKLVITDKPVKRKGYKLLETYQTQRSKEREAARKAASARAWQPRGIQLSKDQVDGLVLPMAKSMKIDPDLAKAIIYVESSRDTGALSHAGAMGLMQLIPETAERFGIKNPWDPRQNIRGGLRYLRFLLSYFEGNVDLVLAAYNAGENAVDRHGGIPPYKETRRYVYKVRKLYKVKHHPFETKLKHRSKLIHRLRSSQETYQVASISTD